jgi:hypothetical protein
MSDLPRQFDLFATSEPEIKGQLLAFTVLMGNLIETLIKNGSLTQEEAITLFHHSDLRTTYIIWEDLKGSAPDSELKRMEQQATRFLSKLQQDISS